MPARRKLVVLGALLGLVGWWSLRGGPAPDPVPERAQARATDRGGERARQAADARGPRGPLPTRTEADEPGAAASDGVAPQPTQGPHLRCRLSESVDAQTGAVYLERGERRYVVARATALGREVSFPVSRRMDTLTLHLAGYEPVPVAFTVQGEGLVCVPGTLDLVAREEMTLTGRVRNTAGNPEPDARLIGCGPGRVDDDGTFTIRPVRAPCTLQAVRQDGFWYSRSAEVEVSWLPGEDYDVDLELNEYPRGGMGIDIGADRDGILVRGVRAGTPAEGAGLAEGDLIVEVSGEPVAGKGLEWFVEQATGEAGTDVTVVVIGSDGDERTVTVTRAVLGP